MPEKTATRAELPAAFEAHEAAVDGVSAISPSMVCMDRAGLPAHPWPLTRSLLREDTRLFGFAEVGPVGPKCLRPPRLAGLWPADA